MDCKEKLEVAANAAAILTFFGGTFAWCYYQYGFFSKKRALEKYLKGHFDRHKATRSGLYQFTSLHLTKELGLTESEILQASYNNKKIHRSEKLDAENFTERLLFGYQDR